MPGTHQDGGIDWHVPKDEKKETKKCGHKIWAFFVSVSDFFVPVIYDDEDE